MTAALEDPDMKGLAADIEYYSEEKGIKNILLADGARRCQHPALSVSDFGGPKYQATPTGTSERATQEASWLDALEMVRRDLSRRSCSPAKAELVSC